MRETHPNRGGFTNLSICVGNIGGLTAINNEDNSERLKRINSSLHEFLKQYRNPHNIFVLQETHMQAPADKDAPNNDLSITNRLHALGKGFHFIHSYSTPADPGAGSVLCYDSSLPPPIDVLLPHLHAHPNLYQISRPFFPGRLMVHAFVFETNVLLLASVYGLHPQKGKNGGNTPYYLIHDAIEIVNAIRNDWISKVPGNDSSKVLLCLCGDFNAFAFQHNSVMYVGRSVLAKGPKQGHKNARLAISELLSTDIFAHAWDLQPRQQGDKYLTNTTRKRGQITSQTGIDHVFISKQHSTLLTAFDHQPLGKPDASITTHDFLRFEISCLWRRPLKGSVPKAAYPILPSYPFHDEAFIEDLLTKIQPLLDTAEAKTQSTGASAHWLSLYDHVFSKLIPDSCNKFHRTRMATMTATSSNLKKEYETLLRDGASSVSHPSFLRFDELRTLIKYHYSFLQKERLLRVKHITAFKELFQEDMEDSNTTNVDETESSLLFYNEEHDNTAKIIPAAPVSIASPNYPNITNPIDLATAANNHYQKIFSKPPPVRARHRARLTRFLGELPKISPSDREMMERLATVEDFLCVLKEYQTDCPDSSPGLDSIPPAFFTEPALHPIVARLLAGTLNAITATAKVPTTMKDIAVRLLYKDGKPRATFTSCRPVSLMCISLRLITKAINNKINPVLDALVNEQQRANVPSRRMDHGVTMLTHLIKKSIADDDSTTGLLQVDFKQAFDSLHHSFIRAVLESAGFGPNMIKTIMTITTSLHARIIVNDILSTGFPVARGVPQGCSLSSVIFILCLEPLLRFSCSKPKAKDGVDLGLNNVPIILWYLGYADDLQIPFQSFAQLKVWLKALKLFASISGLECNWAKTNIHLIGKKYWKLDPTTSIFPTPTHLATSLITTIRTSFPKFTDNCFTVCGDFRFCGVLFSIKDELKITATPHDFDSLQDLTLTSRSWRERTLSLEKYVKAINRAPVASYSKRITFALTKALGRIMFLAFSSLCPSSLIIRIQTTINELVFRRKKLPLALEIASMPAEEGGFNHIDVALRFKALRLTWISQYLKNTLPSMLHRLITDGLKNYLSFQHRNAPPRLPIAVVNAIPHPTALIDAVLATMTKGHQVQQGAHTFDGNTNSTAALPAVVREAFLSLRSLSVSREYDAPNTEILDPDIATKFIFEPLHLNTSLRLQNHPLPAEALPLHSVGLISVHHLLNHQNRTIDAWNYVWTDHTLRTQAHELHQSHKDFKLLGALGSQMWRPLLPRTGTERSTNGTWNDILPQEPLLALRLCQDPLPPPPTDFWTDDPRHVACYPLKVSTPSISDIANSVRPEPTRILLRHMSSKSFYIALKTTRYLQAYTTEPTSVIPTVFTEGHGWPKLLGLPLTIPWRSLLKTLAASVVSDWSRFYCHTFLYSALWCPPAAAMAPNTPRFKLPTHTYSSWSCCPRCDREYTPIHAAYSCPGLDIFWTNIQRVITSVLPTDSFIPRNITAMDIVCCGLPLLKEPTQTSPNRSLLVTIFSCAFKALFHTLRQPQFLQPLPNQVQQTDFQIFAFEQFSSTWSAYLRKQCNPGSIRTLNTSKGLQHVPTIIPVHSRY